MRWAVLSLTILALGCGEPELEIQPVASRARPRAHLRPRSPEVVSPELRVRQTADEAAAERERLGLDGDGTSVPGSSGGGGGSAPDLRNAGEPHRRPTAREIEAYREELADQLEERVDPEANPCDQLRSTWSATASAFDRTLPEGRGQPPGATPSRAQLRRACRQMPAGYLRCMDRNYFDEHRDECQAEIRRLARRGRERSDSARTRLDEIEREDATDPQPANDG